MKVLWITPNIVAGLNKLAGSTKGSGGWIAGTVGELRSAKVDLHVLTINKEINYDFRIINNIKCYGIKTRSGVFQKSNKLEREIDRLIHLINPDIIDLQGIEFCYASFIAEKYRDNTVCTIQGLISNISHHYYAGLRFRELICAVTLRDILTGSTVYSRHKKYRTRGFYEVSALKSAKYFVGRTEWDEMVLKFYNTDAVYYKKHRAISSVFNEGIWTYNNDKTTVYVSQAHLPIKGLHVLLDAISLLKRQGFIIDLVVSGKSRLSSRFTWFDSNYERVLRRKIKKDGLEAQIRFVGLLSQVEMKEVMLSSNLYVQTSYIENSPNSALEALALGMPCLLSDVGGTRDLVDGSGSVFYRHDDCQILSFHLKNLLLNQERLEQMSSMAKTFSIAYSENQKENKLIDFYKMISSTTMVESETDHL